jgi:hypothetical protein
VREQKAPFARGPFEHFRITLAGKPRVLRAHDVEAGLAAQQPAKNTVVEIFVSRQAQHEALLAAKAGKSS